MLIISLYAYSISMWITYSFTSPQHLVKINVGRPYGKRMRVLDSHDDFPRCHNNHLSTLILLSLVCYLLRAVTLTSNISDFIWLMYPSSSWRRSFIFYTNQQFSPNVMYFSSMMLFLLGEISSNSIGTNWMSSLLLLLYIFNMHQSHHGNNLSILTLLGIYIQAFRW